MTIAWLTAWLDAPHHPWPPSAPLVRHQSHLWLVLRPPSNNTWKHLSPRCPCVSLPRSLYLHLLCLPTRILPRSYLLLPQCTLPLPLFPALNPWLRPAFPLRLLLYRSLLLPLLPCSSHVFRPHRLDLHLPFRFFDLLLVLIAQAPLLRRLLIPPGHPTSVMASSIPLALNVFASNAVRPPVL